MLGPLDYFLSMFGLFLEAGVVVCLLRQKNFTKYFPLGVYMLATFTLSIARYMVLFTYGLTSDQYIYFYYLSDSVLTIFLYFVLMGLYTLVFTDMGVKKYLRVGALVLLGATAWFTYEVVFTASTQADNRMLTKFVVVMAQNLYFVGLVLTYLLWGAMLKMRENRLRLIQLVLMMGIYFSVFAANYAFRNIDPAFRFIWEYVPPLMALALPLAWMLTFAKVPEEARLATSRVAHVHHK